jgi:ankyrin repeat protein
VQLLNDIIYHPDSFESQPWLVYFISKPLIGTTETVKIIPASLAKPNNVMNTSEPLRSPNGSTSTMPKKKDIKSFTDLLNNFPMIARQMQPGLDRLFKELGKEFEKPLPALPTRSTTPISIRRRGTSVSSAESFASSFRSSFTNGFDGTHASLELGEEEEAVRSSLETAVTAAIDLFQLVDKQQLSLLGTTTDLTGTMVERMIERYITEQVHESVVFPKICGLRKDEDSELDSRIRQMSDIDISQVGLTLGQSRVERQELAARLSKGVETFKKMGNAGCPQEMMKTLLETQKVITRAQPVAPSSVANRQNGETNEQPQEEKQDILLTINADTLVSLLLVVVIRSPVRHLRASLLYMRHFIFIDDVENGEMGYALSTFEAVLSYLTNDSGALRRASKRNRKLWHATKAGNVTEMRAILEPDPAIEDEDASIEDQQPFGLSNGFSTGSGAVSLMDTTSIGGTTLNGNSESSTAPRTSFEPESSGSLAHVFPFQRPPTPPLEERPKVKKRVSMASHTSHTSSSSGISFRSFAETIGSHASGFDGDTSIERLTMTQGSDGESVMMMAVESGQEKALEYLLNLRAYYPVGVVLDDENNEGTTLLSAAIQSGYHRVTDLLLDFLLDNAESDEVIRAYLARQDTQGRSAAHYLFNYPRLISRIGRLIPWRLKDKNGQTPLFALCRSYDHEEYKWMVDAGLNEAAMSQPDDGQLHLDDHVDGKGNTLLHIVSDPQMVAKLLYQCDSDVNASNDKQFTPLMVASKFGRTDIVRVLFGDARVDLHAKDQRGLTATELAKDDEVRNRIDDLVLLTTPPTPDHRVTTVVRSFFVEDGTVRFIVKSGATNPNSTITVTTCRRALSDFQSLASMLALELPASWLPDISKFPSPFMIPSKPSRSMSRDMQLRLDGFLKILLSHSTFATHEMVWEFFLVPDIDSNMLAERSRRKAETRAEMVRDEYDPLTDVREVEQFVGFAKENVRSLHHANKSVLRRVNTFRLAQTDLYDAAQLCSTHVSALAFMPKEHVTAYARCMRTLAQPDFSPHASFHYSMSAISSTITAILTALNRPSNLISSMQSSQRQLDRHASSYRRSDRWPLGLLDDTRKSMQRDAQEKMEKAEGEIDALGKELRYSQQVVADELAAWQEERVKMGRAALKDLAKRMVVAEKARLEAMLRAIRPLGLGLDEKYRTSKTKRQTGVANGKAPIVFLLKADPGTSTVNGGNTEQ